MLRYFKKGNLRKSEMSAMVLFLAHIDWNVFSCKKYSATDVPLY